MRVTRKVRRRISRRSGFTLLELMIVLAIIVAIVAMVAPNILERQREANNDLARTTIKTIESALKQKAVHNNGEYPSETGSEVIAALAEPSTDSKQRERKPYLEEVPADPWGNPFNYSYDSNEMKPRVWSNGPNGQDDGGSGDDVGNWNNTDT